MIIESERDAPTNDDHPFDFEGPLAQVEQVPTQFVVFAQMHEEIRDAGAHPQLRNDLVKYLWV
jgi:hypothetical protein